MKCANSALNSSFLIDASISAMVDGKIYKFQPVEKSEPDLRSAAHKSLISCELKDWHASSVKTSMHRMSLLTFFMLNFALMAHALMQLISMDFEFVCNCRL